MARMVDARELEETVEVAESDFAVEVEEST